MVKLGPKGSRGRPVKPDHKVNKVRKAYRVRPEKMEPKVILVRRAQQAPTVLLQQLVTTVTGTWATQILVNLRAGFRDQSVRPVLRALKGQSDQKVTKVNVDPKDYKGSRGRPVKRDHKVNKARKGYLAQPVQLVRPEKMEPKEIPVRRAQQEPTVLHRPLGQMVTGS